MTTLGERMKSYEAAYDYTLTNRLPIICRLDGRGFHKFTKTNKCDKPFDDRLSNAMAATMLSVADAVEDCVFGFTQSDEITLVLRNDRSLDSQAWFGNRVQKVNSVIASLTTANFNREFFRGVVEYNPALFDSRLFVVPNMGELINCLVWRQRDCVKNSISAACYYELGKKIGKAAHKLMLNKNGKECQELLFKEAGINWSDYPSKYKNGLACYKETIVVGDVLRTKWKLDSDLPTFSEDRDWVLNKLNFTNNEPKL